MSLALGIAVLAFAVLLGGFAAIFREPTRHLMSMIRTFAVVAAAAVALLHLLPEAIVAVGWEVLAATLFGALGPILLERELTSHRADVAPTTALAMGYAAVIVHQAGEGAVASLAETGALTLAIVLTIAAHTVPLATVVGLRVIEVRGEDAGGHRGAIGLALLGVMAATACGAAAGSLVGGERLLTVQPWLLAAVAGLLLHALSHDALAPASASIRARAGDTLAGWAGLALAAFGIEPGGWLDRVPFGARVTGIAGLAAMIAARSFLGGHHPHHR